MDNTYSLISNVYHKLNTLLSEKIAQNGLNGIMSSHGAIIFALFGNKKLSMLELSDKIGKTPQTVTVLVNKLLSLGYLEKIQSTDDRRSYLVALTEKGEQLKSVFFEISEELYQLQYEGLSQEEITLLRTVLEKINNNLSK